MKITFVMGVPCAGKTTYIKNNFQNRTIIDLYDYQQKLLSLKDVALSYEKCKEALIKAIQNNEDVVMEHTLLKSIRRIPYIEAIREITDSPIEIILLNPSMKILKKNVEKRKCALCYSEAGLDILEIPKKEEGFSKIILVTEKGEEILYDEKNQSKQD